MLKVVPSGNSYQVLLDGRAVPRISVKVGNGHSDISMYRGNFFFKEKRISWRTLPVVEVRANTVTFASETRALTLVFEEEDSRLRLSFDSSRLGPGINRFLIGIAASGDEKVYGCGEQYSYFNLRGRSFPIFTREQGVGRNKKTEVTRRADLEDRSGGDYHTTYYPQPTYVSSSGYFLHLNTFDYTVFDFSHGDSHRLMCYSLPSSVIISLKPTVREAAQDVSAYLGRQEVLPSWVHDGMILGVQGGTQTVLEKLKAAKEHGMKVAGLWAQDWQGIRVTSFGKRLCWNWIWDSSLYPGLDREIPQLMEQGVRFLGYINPYLVENKSLCVEAAQKGYLVLNSHREPYLIDFGEFSCGIVDLTNPEAFGWYKEKLKENLIEFGLKGWMADFGEYLPTDSVLYDGSDPMVAHNLWPGLWARLNYEALRETGMEKEIFFFMRAGNAMSPKYCQSVWAGDQNVDWSRDDGIGSVIPAALSLAMSGHGLHFSDLGGYTTLMNFYRTKELLVRWAQMSCFSAVMKTHEGNRPQSNWQFDSDAQTLDLLGAWTRIHCALKPYIMDCEKENTEEGLAVMRPLVWYYDEPWAQVCQDEYLLGRELLVAPVLKEGARGRTVHLPGGTWIHLFTGKEYSGGNYYCACAWDGFCPPVFYQEGGKHAGFFRKLSGEIKGLVQNN